MPHIDAGRLRRVLAEWCPPFAGYHLYYASRRQAFHQSLSKRIPAHLGNHLHPRP